MPRRMRCGMPRLLAMATMLAVEAKSSKKRKQQKFANVHAVELSESMRNAMSRAVRLAAAPSSSAVPHERTDRKLIFPIFCNSAVMPLLKNLLCSLKRLGVRYWVVVAMDARVCPELQRANFLDSELRCTFPYAQTAEMASAASSGQLMVGSASFWQLVIQRITWIRWLLSEGYDVLQCDVDVVWLRDVRTVLEASPWSEQHLLVQRDAGYGLNCGFYLARASNFTVTLMERWITDMGANGSHTKHSKEMYEQHSFSHVIHTMRSRYLRSTGAPVLRLGQLNQSEFPTGKLWMSYPMLTNKQTAQVVHLNWVKSTKKLHLRRDNLWFLTEDDQRCAAGFDPFEGGCARACVPATTCEMGRPCIYDSTCDHIWRRMTSNRIARERGQGGRARSKNGTMVLTPVKNGTTGGLKWKLLMPKRSDLTFDWHPMALRSLGCDLCNPGSAGWYHEGGCLADQSGKPRPSWRLNEPSQVVRQLL